MTVRSCQRDGKKPLYNCNRWDCQFCLRKKIYWLREQAVNFSQHLAFDQTFFIVLKGFQNAHEADDSIKYIIAREKALKTPYKSKLEYFYVIAKHGFSNWHIHLITNREMSGHAAYCKPSEDLKASCLYLVGNLLRSADADYAGVRRYGASRLLYKQSMKKAFKTRLRRWLLIVTMALVQTIILALSSWYAPLPYRVNLGYVEITQAQRYYRGTTEELTFRTARDDIVGEWEKQR
jgi:hypothetical protein